jgi:hypothetical protein
MTNVTAGMLRSRKRGIPHVEHGAVPVVQGHKHGAFRQSRAPRGGGGHLIHGHGVSVAREVVQVLREAFAVGHVVVRENEELPLRTPAKQSLKRRVGKGPRPGADARRLTTRAPPALVPDGDAKL